MPESHPLRILAVGAHPDDIELGCAGTLARCVQRGDCVVMAVTCQGNSASAEMAESDLVKLRRQEAEASAGILGAELIWAGLRDFHVECTEENKRIFSDIIRRAQPDVVITHYYQDYGGDHNNTFELVLDATLSATIRNFSSDLPPIPKVPFLYMMEPLGSYGFQPQVYVEITDTFAAKFRMLECHQSQVDFMSRYDGQDFRKSMELVARFRGYQSGVEMAEGFVPHPSWAHMPAYPVLP